MRIFDITTKRDRTVENLIRKRTPTAGPVFANRTPTAGPVFANREWLTLLKPGEIEETYALTSNLDRYSSTSSQKLIDFEIDIPYGCKFQLVKKSINLLI